WERLPDDLRTIVAKNLNQAGKDERADVAKLNASVKEDLISKGMAFNDTDASLFRAALKEAGFYSEWKSKYGDEAWAILEKAVGASLT
ncbi:MAG: TRAP transporter substrate-binding protein, partial [Rhizobium pusense]|nr:TRAP transporter substrate-binding protein [Agrobacterium pusense]